MKLSGFLPSFLAGLWGWLVKTATPMMVPQLLWMNDSICVRRAIGSSLFLTGSFLAGVCLAGFVDNTEVPTSCLCVGIRGKSKLLRHQVLPVSKCVIIIQRWESGALSAEIVHEEGEGSLAFEMVIWISLIANSSGRRQCSCALCGSIVNVVDYCRVSRLSLPYCSCPWCLRFDGCIGIPVDCNTCCKSVSDVQWHASSWKVAIFPKFLHGHTLWCIYSCSTSIHGPLRTYSS